MGRKSPIEETTGLYIRVGQPEHRVHLLKQIRKLNGIFWDFHLET